MPQVKVWNDNDYPHQEMYKGETIRIAPKSSIEMDYEEAMQFAGQFTPIVKQADGRDDPRHFKKIRVEKPAQVLKDDPSMICHANGKRASTPEELQALLSEFAHLRANDPEAEKAAAAYRANEKSEVMSLKEQVEALRAQMAALASDKASKKPMGRPKKEANA